MKADVFIRPINNDLKIAIKECFDKFGGVDQIIKGNVFLKINGTMPDLSGMTDIDLILGTIEVIKENSSNYQTIYVCDNSAVGCFTRLTFLMNNLSKRIKQLGAKPLYLDEQKSVLFNFNGKVLDKPIPIPKIIYDNLIVNKEKNTYINLPKLKSHMQCGLTNCIKNHHGFLYDDEKIYKHHLINEKVVDIIRVLKPDFNLVDAITVCDYGPVAFDPAWQIPMGLLLAGTDPVAVDTVGTRLIGIDEVKHIHFAAARNLGCANFDEINVIPSRDLINKYKIQLHCTDMPFEPNPKLKLFYGTEKCCAEGCKGLSIYFNQLIKGDKIKPSIGIMGKGHTDHLKEFDEFDGIFICVGPCAVQELKPYFESRIDKKKITVFYLNEHMDISGLVTVVFKVCKVPMSELTQRYPFSIFRLILSFINAKIHGVKCRFI